jgi:YggT family protein
MIEFVATFVNLLLQALSWAIIIRVLLSWFPNINQNNPLIQLLRSVTDPILEPARRLIPSMGAIDVSPIVVLLVLDFVVRPVLLQLLYSL